MAESTEKTSVAKRASGLSDEVLESVYAGRRAADRTNPFAGMSTRTCEHCAAAMKLVEEHAISEQYTRQTWWKCTECGRSRYYRA